MIRRFTRATEFRNDRPGVWSVRVTLERDDGTEEGAFLKLQSREQPTNSQVAAEVQTLITARNAPVIDPFADLPNLPAVSDIPRAYRLRLWEAFKEFIFTLLGRP